ncbi:hypothetical protein KKB41_02870, partial [Patescibacteria group bacterium]|nr:hypothetical protein [Patescibacteria group bacterium]
MKKTIINYNQAVRFIESLSNTAASQKGRDVEIIKERLRNVKRFLKFLGNPEKKLKIIHIAGTSGKGSVVAMLHSILQADNKKVGSYTSPHTTTYCERIKVGDKYISEKELIDAVNFLKDRMDEYMQRDANISNYTRMPRKNTRIESHSSRHSCAFAFFESRLSLNFFEFSFCLAIYYFAKQHCEYAVIETGCGGRYDASNAIKKPVYTIITNIGPDHLDIFGNLKNIANEKAGIIKSGVPLLTGETDKRWINMFKKEL